mmetsp:Transcript_47244/g.151398  ORF Transcript_47244/g.151398 Transcript_47244/m.151398 type:complete len:167 (+) Transcript_47244:1807-2307(+)
MSDGMSTGMKVAVGLAAAGAVAYAASAYLSTSSPAKGKKQVVTLELEKVHLDWLQKMADTYKLPDAGKAMRCLINFGVEGAKKERDAIFQKKRCKTCGKKNKREAVISLEEHQHAWLMAAVTAYGIPDLNKAARIMCEFGMSKDADLASIFTVVRCTHGTTCSTCK